MPNLAKKITEGNEAGENPFVNIVGIMIGNAVTDKEVSRKCSKPLFAWSTFKDSYLFSNIFCL